MSSQHSKEETEAMLDIFRSHGALPKNTTIWLTQKHFDSLSSEQQRSLSECRTLYLTCDIDDLDLPESSVVEKED